MTRLTPRARRAWLGIGAVAWAVVLVIVGIGAARNGRPTAREQTTIVEALPTVDRAIAAVVTAAAGPQVVLSVAGYERTESRCNAGYRDGERYQRVALFYTTPGRESALVDRISQALPAAYETRVRKAGGVSTLSADAGFYVRLTGGVIGAGELRFTADTGCRLLGGEVPVASSGGAPTVGGAAEALGRLTSTELGRRTDELACPAGGSLRTVTVTAAKPPKPLSAALPHGVAAVISRDDLLVYAEAATGIALRLRADDMVLTATTGCA